MKHLIILSLFTFHFSLLTLSASAAVPLHWTVETSRATPAQFEAYQGETLALEAALQSYGKPLEAPLSYSLYWQTNGMGSTYWSVPCTQPNSNTLNSNNSNTLYATWSPTNDVGARVYNCFIGQPGTIYHAAFNLRLRPSPGATPNELPLPQKVIDFAKVTVLNPPWSGGGGGVDTNAVREIAREEIAPATNAVNVAMTNRYTKSETDAKLSPIEEQIAALQSGKRDIDDMRTVAYGPWEPDPRPSGRFLDLAYNDSMDCWSIYDHTEERYIPSEPKGNSRSVDLAWSADEWEGGYDISFHRDRVLTTSDLLARTSQLPSDDQLLTAEQRAEIAKVKDKADEFTEWDINITPSVENPSLVWENGKWNVYSNGEFYFYFELSGASYEATSINTYVAGFIVTATRKRVLRTGDAATPQELTNAISTNNPAFVSAVRNTPTSGMPEDMPSDWGTYGTVGAALAALAAFVKWAKAKIVAVIGNDGKPTDTFATDLLGKQVAKEPDKFVGETDRTNWNGKANESDLPIPISSKSAGFTTESYKRFVVSSMPSAGLTLTLHTPTGSNADVFECRFDGSALSADASVSLVGATAKTMDTDCGTVKAGKVALMSAFWNGATWDVNWKVEG